MILGRVIFCIFVPCDKAIWLLWTFLIVFDLGHHLWLTFEKLNAVLLIIHFSGSRYKARGLFLKVFTEKLQKVALLNYVKRIVYYINLHMYLSAIIFNVYCQATCTSLVFVSLITQLLRWVGRLGPKKLVKGWVTAVIPTDRPKSVRNCCVIELFCGVFLLLWLRAFSVVKGCLSYSCIRSLPHPLDYIVNKRLSSNHQYFTFMNIKWIRQWNMSVCNRGDV